jgi:uncharacterized protein (TIGR00255 family)
MIRSMTGFGSAEGRVGRSSVSVELRTVNHRYFSPSIKLPSSLSRWETEVREALRQKITRGHVTLAARTMREQEGLASIDETRFAAYARQLRDLRDRYGLAGDVDVATVLRMPEVVGGGGEEDDSGSAAELVAVVNEALAALTRMREEEGRRLAAVVLERLDLVSGALDRIAERAPQRLVAQRDRLRASVKELTEGVAVDEARIAQEIALLADRLDVSEELDRFRTHIAAFRAAMRDSTGEGVGKRLGFLLQEMLREANTTGSKANDAAVVGDVLLIKEELERIREQVENLE